jgi:glutamine synthetase adenylyltransferase
MKLPSDEVRIDDETIVAGEVPTEGDEPKDKEKVDDTTAQGASKKETEEANARMAKLEASNQRLTEIFTSPDFFSKMASSMKPAPEQVVKAEPTSDEMQRESDKLDAMNRQDFLSHTLKKVSEATTAAIKPEIDKLATQMSTFITGQAQNTAEDKVADLVKRIGQAEFDKHGAVMQAKANVTKGLSMDELYELASGKKAPKYIQPVVPNKTHKPGEGLRESTEAKDLSLDEAGSQNFDNIFGKYKK